MGDNWILWALGGATLLMLAFAVTLTVTRRRPIRHKRANVWQAGHYWTAGGAHYGFTGDGSHQGGCGGGSSGCGGGGCGGGGCGGGGCGGGGCGGGN